MTDQLIRILLVEDNPGDAFLIQAMLDVNTSDQSIQFQLVHVEDLEQAIARLQAESFEVILLDLMLPDSQGIDTLLTVETAEASELPIVVLTGMDDERLAIQAVQQGAQDYLIKGQVSQAVLVHAIRYAIERQQIEQTLKQRTLELETANRDLYKKSQQLGAVNAELEAINHTISHDLRNTLSGVTTACALLEKFAERQEKAKRYVSSIKTYTRNMTDLLSSLQQLSQISRSKIQNQSVNLSAMARTIAAQLQQQQPARQAKLVIAPNLKTMGDRSQIQLVLENLIGNAWKFTSNCEEAQIEFGACHLSEIKAKVAVVTGPIQQSQDQIVYFVKDNGIGFDMLTADKLFVPFQRLPAAQDFQGQGIGLAIVQRIVHGHEGWIWFESAVDQGATFYWTFGVD